MLLFSLKKNKILELSGYKCSFSCLFIMCLDVGLASTCPLAGMTSAPSRMYNEYSIINFSSIMSS